MAVRAIAKQTPQQRAIADRVRRARPPATQYDPDVYAEAGEFARLHGLDPPLLFDEIESRADARVLADNVSPIEAARLALTDVLERYGHRKAAG